jgi:uncharacterized membrane protein (UPF0182 family)
MLQYQPCLNIILKNAVKKMIKKYYDLLFINMMNLTAWLFTDTNAEQILKVILLLVTIIYTVIRIFIIIIEQFEKWKKKNEVD